MPLEFRTISKSELRQVLQFAYDVDEDRIADFLESIFGVGKVQTYRVTGKFVHVGMTPPTTIKQMKESIDAAP